MEMNRLDLLKEIIDTKFEGKQSRFAKAIKKAPSLVHQWVKEHRKFGDASARHVELTLGLPIGYFNQTTTSPGKTSVKGVTGTAVEPGPDIKGRVPLISYVQAGNWSEAIEFMPDDAINEITGSINELLGRHPSLWTLFEKTVHTITRLGHMGNCIIVGRGGNEITQGFSNVIRVRLIGSEKRRLQQMTKVHGMSESGAKKFVKEENAARRRYIKQHFQRDIDDPTRYDLVINTDNLSDDAIVELLIAALKDKR